MRNLIVILGTPVDNLNMEATLKRMEAFVQQGRATGRTFQVVTVNADFVVKARQDPELRYLLQNADLATADGMPVVWGARLLGGHIEERVAGADLVPRFAARAAQKGYSIYLLGAAPGVAARAAHILQERHPTLRIAGFYSPPYRPVLEMDESIPEKIRAARPDVLLIAFGNPKQEKWMGMYAHQLGVPLMMGVGGTLDFITGTTRRAPLWMQKNGLEWLYRLIQEPGRLWRRYAVDLGAFTFLFACQWLQMRRGASDSGQPFSLDLKMEGDTAVLSIGGSMAAEHCQRFWELAEQALDRTVHLVIDLNAAQHLDSSALGTLVELARIIRQRDGSLALRAVPARIQKSLAFLKLDTLLRTETSCAGEVQTKSDTTSTVRDHGRWVLLTGPRFFDAGTASQVIADCQQALQRSPFVILDLSTTDFITSAGLAALATMTRLAREAGGELRVSGCSKDVMQVITMANFHRLLALYDNLTSAAAQG